MYYLCAFFGWLSLRNHHPTMRVATSERSLLLSRYAERPLKSRDQTWLPYNPWMLLGACVFYRVEIKLLAWQPRSLAFDSKTQKVSEMLEIWASIKNRKKTFPQIQCFHLELFTTLLIKNKVAVLTESFYQECCPFPFFILLIKLPLNILANLVEWWCLYWQTI